MTATPNHADLGLIIATIARSPLVVAQPAVALPRLPAGFDRADAGILMWIAAEGRRFGRALVRH